MIEYNCEVTFIDGHVSVYTLDMSKPNVVFWQFISDDWDRIDSVEIHKNFKELE